MERSPAAVCAARRFAVPRDCNGISGAIYLPIPVLCSRLAAQLLAAAGVCLRVCLRVYLRLWPQGYGIAEGRPSERACNEALESVYRWVTDKLSVPSDDIILMGRSIGTGPCAHLAAQLSRDSVGGLVLLSSFCSVKSIVRHVTNTGTSRKMAVAGKAAQLLIQDRFDNLEALRAVCCPVLLLHGVEDQVCSMEDAESLYDACTSTQHRQLCLIPAMDHDNILQHAHQLVAQIGRVFDCKAKPGRPLPVSVSVMVCGSNMTVPPHPLDRDRAAARNTADDQSIHCTLTDNQDTILNERYGALAAEASEAEQCSASAADSQLVNVAAAAAPQLSCSVVVEWAEVEIEVKEAGSVEAAASNNNAQ